MIEVNYPQTPVATNWLQKSHGHAGKRKIYGSIGRKINETEVESLGYTVRGLSGNNSVTAKNTEISEIFPVHKPALITK